MCAQFTISKQYVLLAVLVSSRKTQVGNFEMKDIRPPRFIGRDGVGALLIEFSWVL